MTRRWRFGVVSASATSWVNGRVTMCTPFENLVIFRVNPATPKVWFSPGIQGPRGVDDQARTDFDRSAAQFIVRYDTAHHTAIDHQALRRNVIADNGPVTGRRFQERERHPLRSCACAIHTAGTLR